jgi:hypothetical protein
MMATVKRRCEVFNGSSMGATLNLIKKQYEKVYNLIVCRNILIGAHSQFSGNYYVSCDCRSIRVMQQHVKCVILC